MEISVMKKIPIRQLLFTFIASISALVLVAGMSIILGVDIPLMTRDVAAIGNIHPLYGFLSSLGILLWCAVVSICFFMARVLRHSNQREIVNFLYYSALLTLYLMLDDLFQFHDSLVSQYLGLKEKVVYLILGVAVSAYLLTFRALILKTNYYFLLLALVFLGFSVVIDAILPPELWRLLGHWEYFIEDGAKWLGIVAWCSYFVNTSHQFLESEFSSTDPFKRMLVPSAADGELGVNQSLLQ
jgi:hypothetical protein